MHYTISLSFILITASLYSQNSSQKNGESKKNSTVKPVGKLKTFNPNEKHITINTEFETLEKRIEYMQLNMASNCLNGKTYTNSYRNLFYKENEAIVDSKFASGGMLFTIKISENSLFVFLFHNLCDAQSNPNGKVNLTYFNYKFGEVDNTRIKSLEMSKKRLYIDNNTFTEELLFGKLKFIIEDHSTLTKLFIGDKMISITKHDINRGF